MGRITFYLLLLLGFIVGCAPSTGPTQALPVAQLNSDKPTPTITPTETPPPTATPTKLPTATPSPSPTQNAWETADGIITRDVQLRDGGGPNYNRIGLLPVGTEVKFQARQGDWILVDSGSFLSGWVTLSTLEANPAFDLLGLPVVFSPPPLAELLQFHQAVTYQPTDVFVGPGANYALMGGTIPPNSPIQLAGRDDIGLWVQIEDEFSTGGWILASFLRYNPSYNIMDLPILVEPPDREGDWDYDWSTMVFEWGAQTHDMRHSNEMQGMGMQWVKVQHKFHEYSQPRDVVGLVNQAHDRGFKILLSITGEPYPEEIDFEGYVEFMAGVSALPNPPDAVEIWNEMNIDFEWPAGEIDPVDYVEKMLKPTYLAIKESNEEIMVISGAPAPTGFNDGYHAWADDRYVAGMVQADALGFLDCVGVHYNAGATSPYWNSGHPAGNFYGWYFQPTLQMYWRTTQQIKPLCITEIGYLTDGDLPKYEMPANFWWA
ncbi:MAG: hypothetical protein AAF633_07070, partial [Chloroflexota bacterium]